MGKTKSFSLKKHQTLIKLTHTRYFLQGTNTFIFVIIIPFVIMFSTIFYSFSLLTLKAVHIIWIYVVLFWFFLNNNNLFQGQWPNFVGMHLVRKPVEINISLCVCKKNTCHLTSVTVVTSFMTMTRPTYYYIAILSMNNNCN